MSREEKMKEKVMEWMEMEVKMGDEGDITEQRVRYHYGSTILSRELDSVAEARARTPDLTSTIDYEGIDGVQVKGGVALLRKEYGTCFGGTNARAVIDTTQWCRIDTPVAATFRGIV
ncbi:hypothetical protein TWF718_002826 [Orbilia javanica]|uniref:Uncharacterized protein n=1 Tax=Orbilia javanica TaxID=47235 RepID=A0AAN8NL04_9PEZI